MKFGFFIYVEGFDELNNYQPLKKVPVNCSYLGEPIIKCLLLLLLLLTQSFDWLAAFHLELLQAILFIAV